MQPHPNPVIAKQTALIVTISAVFLVFGKCSFSGGL
jgi:hypothetical protein